MKITEKQLNKIKDNVEDIYVTNAGYNGPEVKRLKDVIKEIEKMNSDISCEKCEYYHGRHTMTGIGSTWPCMSCRVDNFELKKE